MLGPSRRDSGAPASSGKQDSRAHCSAAPRRTLRAGAGAPGVRLPSRVRVNATRLFDRYRVRPVFTLGTDAWVRMLAGHGAARSRAR